MTEQSNSPPQFTQQVSKPGMSMGKKIGLGCGGLLIVFTVLIGGCAVLVGMSATNDRDDTRSMSADDTSTTTEPALYPERPDTQPGDKEREIGQSVDVSGYTTTVSSAGFQQSMNPFEDKGYLVVDTTIANRDTKAQPYSSFDFKLITPNGQIIDPTYSSASGQLQSADLASGGTVSGKVIFEVGDTKGDYFVVYDPDLGTSDRGVWKTTI